VEFDSVRIVPPGAVKWYPAQGVFWLLSWEYFGGTPLGVGGGQKAVFRGWQEMIDFPFVISEVAFKQ
jgi:hypothetical protein